MKHPLSGKALLFYLLAWAAIIVAHANILYYQLGFDFIYSVTDSLIYNISFLGFGLLYWYVVQYITPNNQGITATVLNQGLAVVIGVSFLTYLCNSFLASFGVDNPDVSAFLSMSIPWRIFLGTFFLGMIVLVYYLLQYTSSLKQKEKDEVELQHLLKNAELETLKFQLNPHFIFNSLNSISSLTLTNPEKAHEMVVKLSEFLRGSLGQKEAELHTLKDELAQMNRYLEIERIRFGDRLVLEEDINEGCYDRMVPNLILQPLYENAIKYGIYEQLESVKIFTRTYCTEEYLTILISNNYDSESTPQKGKGIGLKNVRNRLELIYGKSDLVTIKRERDNFTIELQIPQTQKRKDD
ncbi:MAG: histidine kinase [Fulvivirga sp.]|uniref:sensor histidine kinase n=1 Tax=Fulvivirga sp. TaxID=1931237 RepID=UPI0032EE905B